MPSSFQWWASESEEDVFIGPYPTKEQAIANALTQDVYRENDDDGSISIFVCEAQTATADDISIDTENLLYDLENRYEDICSADGELFPHITKEDKNDLEAIMNEAFRTWAKDRDIRPFGFYQTRNEEHITMRKPEQAPKEE